MKLKTAFTLIELLVVIAIIGILSGLIVVTMSGVTSRANVAKSQVFSNSLRNALMLNLVSEWKLDGNAVDTWGGKNGTLHGTTSVTTDCPQGTCLSFNGTSDYINIADDAVFNFGSKMTAMVWVKGGAQNTTTVFCQYDNALEKRSWGIDTSNGGDNKLRVMLSDDGTSSGSHMKQQYSNSVVFDNKWHLVGFTWNSGTLSTYVDGQASTETPIGTIGNSLYNSDVNLTIGSRINNGSPNYFFTGSIDEARLYNEVIPISQIKEQYYSGLNGLFTSGSISEEEYSQRIANYVEN
jgi:prepilin-type N-terminal cleavage/methylation domain-containing protein